MSLSSTTIDTPVGEITIVAGPRGVRAVLFAVEEIGDFVAEPVDGDDPAATSIAVAAAGQLVEYFAGERHEFDLPLDPQGTPFQLSVWQVLRTIPYGKTISYGDQARQLGDVRKSRAVGAANGRNPISIIVPCHRVVGSTGKLTGFAAGLDAKAWLLHHEQGVSGLGL